MFCFRFFLDTENDMNFGQNAKLLNWSFDNLVTVLAASDLALTTLAIVYYLFLMMSV